MDRHRWSGSSFKDVIGINHAVFRAALERGDARAAALVYAEDARILAPSAELIDGRQAIQAFWQAGLDAGVRQIDLESLQLERQNGIAYEIGRYVLRLRPEGGGMVVDRGKYVLVHRQQLDGSWTRVVEMFNPDVQPATPNPTVRIR